MSVNVTVLDLCRKSPADPVADGTIELEAQFPAVDTAGIDNRIRCLKDKLLTAAQADFLEKDRLGKDLERARLSADEMADMAKAAEADLAQAEQKGDKEEAERLSRRLGTFRQAHQVAVVAVTAAQDRLASQSVIYHANALRSVEKLRQEALAGVKATLEQERAKLESALRESFEQLTALTRAQQYLENKALVEREAGLVQ